MNPFIPILLYHGVGHHTSPYSAPFTVSPDTFARHLDLVIEKGFRCITVTELVEGNVLHTGDNRPIALITFDDGYADFAEHAVPALVARNLSSTMYVTTGWLDGGDGEHRNAEPMLSFSQLPELAEAGVEFGAHSHSHPHLDTLSPGRAWEELVRSKALVEDALGAPVPAFAYPHGYNSPRLRQQVRQAGFTSAAGVRNALSFPGDNPFCIARLMLRSDTGIEQVEAWLDGHAPMATAREALKTKGWRAYRRARSIATRQPGSDYRGSEGHVMQSSPMPLPPGHEQ